ncbi:hypothetical protein [Planococcus sp. YIM B11945]|uniref:hypothetical protein n=1 Tax=Planococcus sp. YIM B11945 TaxID=3435410 RepID=UPI003D7D35CA
MEFEIGNGAIVFPNLHITIMAIVIIYLLVKWSKELETDRYKVFFYFFDKCLHNADLFAQYNRQRLSIMVSSGICADFLILVLRRQKPSFKNEGECIGACDRFLPNHFSLCRVGWSFTVVVIFIEAKKDWTGSPGPIFFYLQMHYGNWRYQNIIYRMDIIYIKKNSSSSKKELPYKITKSLPQSVYQACGYRLSYSNSI